MSSSAYNFLGAEHTITIPEQLNAGARFLMLDAYYGYDDNGIVRTNLAGGVDREQLEKERGEEAVRRARPARRAHRRRPTRRARSRTLYFCHDFCELGAVQGDADVFADIDAFLDRNLTDVVMLDFEDYVQPKDIKRGARRRRPVGPGLDARARRSSAGRRCSTWSCPKDGTRPRTRAG